MKTVHANNSDGGQTRSTITLPTIAIDPIYHYQMQKVLDMDTYSLGVKGTLWLNIWSTPSHVELADWSNNWSWFQDSNHLRLSKYSAKHPAMRLLHEAGHLSTFAARSALPSPSMVTISRNSTMGGPAIYELSKHFGQFEEVQRSPNHVSDSIRLYPI